MRILVTAASKYGGTAGIAEAIGRTLEDESLEVDVLPVEEVSDLDGYDSVVLGSGVYAGRWLRSARRFADEHADELSEKPTWLFSSGPIGDPPKPEGEAAVKLGAIPDRTHANGHRVFAGRLDKSRMTFADKAIVTAVRSPEGDFRDWEAVQEWAGEIAKALK
jgi:menaquinone-dependent protoporphyrinogen oxidase